MNKYDRTKKSPAEKQAGLSGFTIKVECSICLALFSERLKRCPSCSAPNESHESNYFKKQKIQKKGW